MKRSFKNKVIKKNMNVMEVERMLVDKFIMKKGCAGGFEMEFVQVLYTDVGSTNIRK
jgi:hypothetical protein